MKTTNKFQRLQYIKQLDKVYDSLDNLIIDKAASGLYDKILSQLKSLLAGTYKKQQKLALDEAVHYLVNVSRIQFAETDITKINKILETHLGKDLPSLVETNMAALTSKVLKTSIKEIGGSLKMKLSFDLVDKEAAEILNKQNLFWVGNFYGEQVEDKIKRTLNNYFTEGFTIEDAAAKLEVQFFDATDKGISYFEGLAEHTTSRVREIGHINGYEKAGVEYLQVKAIIDDRTSEICRRMNNTIIPVSSAASQRDKILSAGDDPEKIKTIAPWRDASELPDVPANIGINFKKLPGGMQLPPYHWRCRTVTVAYFK